MSSNKRYKIFVDLDGTLVDFMSGTVQIMNEQIRAVADNINRYKEEKPKFYKAVNKAVQELGGDLDLGILGEPVIADYVKKTTNKKKVRNLMYAIVANNYDFWVNLSWMSDGQRLWNYIKKYDVEVLSAPMRENSKKGKYDWCQKELGLGADKVTLTHSKETKAAEALAAGFTPILIDDMAKYVLPFKAAGGLAVYHSDASNTIKELKEIGL